MIRSFFLRNFWFLFVTIVVLLFACNDGNTEKPNHVEATAAPAVAAGITSGMLDTLKVDRAAFDALPSGKLVFSFVFGANDTLTMHGWSLHGGSKNYDSLPNIKLVKKAASLVPYGNGTYFGNVILATSDVNSIKHLLNSNNAQWVLFAPKLQGNNIVYTIFVAKNGPGTLIETKAIATGIDANPSPPKNY